MQLPEGLENTPLNACPMALAFIVFLNKYQISEDPRLLFLQAFPPYPRLLASQQYLIE